MSTKSRAIVRHRDGVDLITMELPPYAVRYLSQMCARERTILSNLAAGGVYNVALDAAYDALNQIESAIP